ncbi:MAG: hypothetical protein QOH71_670 [Blastocatellia bacterium]|nr:hypothetical protein [Blastocatellia bacterium]
MIKICRKVGRSNIFSDLVDSRQRILSNCWLPSRLLTVSFFNDNSQVRVLSKVKRLKQLNLTIFEYCSKLTAHVYCSLAQLG